MHRQQHACLPSLLVVAPNEEVYEEKESLDDRQQAQKGSMLVFKHQDSSKIVDDNDDSRREFMRSEWQEHRLSLLGKQIHRPAKSSGRNVAHHSIGLGGNRSIGATRSRNSRQLRWMIRVKNFLEQPQSPLAWLYHCSL